MRRVGSQRWANRPIARGSSGCLALRPRPSTSPLSGAFHLQLAPSCPSRCCITPPSLASVAGLPPRHSSRSQPQSASASCREYSTSASSSPSGWSNAKPQPVLASADVTSLSLLSRAWEWPERTAVTNLASGVSYSYAQLLRDSHSLARRMIPLSRAKKRSSTDIGEARVGLLCPADYSYVLGQWAIWSAGGVAVPVGVHNPPPEIEYIMQDADVSLFVTSPEFAPTVEPLAQKLNIPCVTCHVPPPAQRPGNIQKIELDRGAHIVYTSGTTGKPKGVYTTHRNLEAQVKALVEAWEWRKEDRILNVLPLHHVHGIVAVVTSALWSGAECEMMTRFDAKAVWRRFCDESRPLTIFMAVPTIYVKLIEEYRKMSPEDQKKATAACKKFRVMVSGSMALPETVMHEWEAISGHKLLERYGMTEFGMAISNPLHGERLPGCVGRPLPGYQARIVPSNQANGEAPSAAATAVKAGVHGDLHVRGPAVFKEYWRKPVATAEVFTPDGWFVTGDVAEYVDDEGTIKILGRSSVDILKSGGYKLSALDIERVLLEHESIAECAVLGVPDPAFGQRVAVVLVQREGTPKLELEGLKDWARDKLASYKVPREILVLPSMPRNAMGKVNKKDLLKLFPSAVVTPLPGKP